MSAVDEAPSWLSELRSAAAERYKDAQLPTDDQEVWRYSRIADVDFEKFRSIPNAKSTADPVGLPNAAASITVRDGWVVELAMTDDLDGALVCRLEDHPEAEALYGSVRGAAPDAIAELHDANLCDPMVIDVPEGVKIASPIVLDHYSEVEDGLTTPHTIVRTGRGASVSVLERRRSGAADQLVLPWVEIDAGTDSNVGYLTIQQLGPNTISFEQNASRADERGHVVTALAAFGGSYARARTDFRLLGRGASGDLLSAYFGDGAQMLDFRTFQEHAAPDTTSNLLFKGAVTGSAESVYTGLIRVRESAPGTKAFQTNRNLKLSDEAWAYSVPNLEIEQNDVSCSHASTVGEIAEDERFYLESRGVPTTVAEQLLVSGFFAEVIDQMPIDEVKAELQQIIDVAIENDRASHLDSL